MVKAGVVQHVSGKFYVQSENGDIKILKVGDTIYQGDKVFGDPSNLTSHRLEILDDSGNTVVLVGLDNAIFDVSTVEKTFTNEEFSFAPVKLWSAKDEDVNLQAKADDTDITDEETAAGEEAGGVNSTDNGVFMYNQRDGLMVDASSSLRGNSLGRSDFNTPPFIDPLLQEGDETPIVLMAPSIPTIFVYDDKAPITGFISNGTVTDDDTPTISGQTDPNLKVDIFDNGTHLGSTNSDNSGDYTFTPTTPLDEGEHNIYVSVTGEDGTKVNSDTISFVVDVTAPDTPIVEITTDVNNDGFINADESNGKVDVKITVNNSTEIDDIIVVKDNFGHSYTITVTQEILNNGIIVTFPQPSEGEEIVVTATVQDPAGNISDEGRDSAKIDTSDLSLFGGISVEIVNDVDNNNLIGKDELGSNNTLTVEVTLQKLIVAGDKLIVTGTGNSDKEIILTQADIDKGTVQVDFQAPNNGVTFETTALAIDPAGNQSNLAKDWAKIDLTAPDAPTVEITTDINNDGFINAEESNGKIDVKITVSSNTEIGSVLTVSDNYGHTQNITVTESILNNGTTLSFPEPAEGKEIVIIATAKDPAGNISDEGRDSAIMDRSDLSLGLEVEIITDTNNDGYINKYELHNNTIEIKVTLSPNAVEGDTLSVTGTGNNTQIITLNSDHINNGFINLEFQAIEDGKTFITTALLEDPAGNRSNLATDSAKIDLTAPDAPIVEITTDINNDGFINANESNGNVDVKITVPSGTELGSTIIVNDNFGHGTNITVTQEILNNGAFVTFPQPNEGEVIIVTANIKDPAGNISDEGRDSAKIDTSDLSLFGGISVEIVNDVDNNNLIGKDELGSNNTLTVEITLQQNIVAGDKLIVTGTGNSDKEIILTQAQIDSGKVQVEFNAPSNGVTFETTALAIDPAGNQSNLAKDWAKIDLTAPDAPTVEITTDINNDGYINAEESNGKIDVKITVPSSTDIGSTIYVQDNYNNGTTITVTQSIINNGVIVSFPEPQEGSEIIVTSYIKDLAGNISNPGNDRAIMDTSDLSGIKATILNDIDNNGLIGADEIGANNTLTVEVTLQQNVVAGDKLIITGTNNNNIEIILTQTQIDSGKVQVEFNAPNNGVTFETTALVIDPAGNRSNLATDSAKIDLTAPDAPIVEITTDINNDGFINANESNGNVDVKITVPSGTELGSTIIVNDNFGHGTNITVTQEILNNGAFVTFPQPNEGEVIIVTANIKDPAGNISDEGRDSAKIDTSDLSLFGGISVEIVNDVDNNNLIGKDELGSNNTLTVEITLQQNIVAGDKLIVTGTGNSDKEIILTQAQIDSGKVQVEFNAPSNGVTFETTALAIDPAGNQSNLAKDWAKIDLTAPDAPTVEITTDINNDGYINAEESNGKIDVKITVPSSTDIGSTIYVQDNYNNGTTITVTQSIINNGVIVSFPEPQEGSEIIVTSYIKDLAGNKGKEGQDSAILDTSNLSLGLAVEITTDNNNDGYISKDELQDSNIDVKVTLSPNAAIGDTLTVTGSANTPQIISLTAEHINNGYVYLEFNAPSDGSNFVTTAQLKDIAGNKSNLATDSAIMLLSAPGKPIVTITEDENNDGYINAKELKGDIGVSVALPGTALSGDTLYIDTNSDGISDIGIVLTLQDIQKGSVSFEVEYKGQDFIKVDAWVTDKAGNNSEVGSDEAIIDLIPPQKPTIELYDDEAPYIGVIHSGSTTNDSTPTISGETEANVKVDIYDNGKLIGTTTSDNNGNYTFTPTTKLTDGGHNVYVTATDKAGNSSDSDNIDFAILTTTPQKPEIVDIIDHTGDYSSVTLYGKGEAGLTITLYSVEGSTTSNNQGAFIAVATTIVDANGNWSVDISNLPNTPINDNEFFYAIQTNTAGISSTQSNSVHYYHGDWEIMLTEKEDDFIFTGNDDDVIKVIADDQDDYLVIDGGNGIDKAVFNGKVADFTISKNAKGHTIITSLNPSTDSDLDGTGDIVELRNMEFAEFDDGTYDIEKETFIPTISIIDNNLIEDEAKIIAQAKDIDGIVSLESYIASHGTIELDQNGNIIYTPNADYSGSDHVTITVIDDKGAKATKVVDLWIEPVADKPLLTISVEAQSSFEGNAYTTASQDLGKLALYLNGQNQISAEEIIELQKGPAGNTRLDQYNVELDSFGDGDVAMYGNDRNIHSIDLASSAVITPLETPTVDFAGARLVKNNVFVTRNMKSNKEVFADNTINTDTINGTKGSDALNIGGLTKNSSFYTKDGDDVIVSREGSKIQGSIINTGDGNDTLILNGDISGTTIHTDIAGNTGNDKVFINGSLGNTNIHTFGGHDYVEISGDINTSQVYTGAGNDVIIINTKNITGYNIVDSGTGNDIIIINGHLKDTTIDARDGNDLIALSTFDNVKVDGGMGIDIIYLSKPADRYYFQSATLGYDVNGTGNMTGILVDKDTGGKLYFFNIEGFAFGDGSGLNTNYTTHLISQYTIDIDAALTDRDGSEELSILITGVPSSAVLSSDTYDLKNNNDGTWSLIVPKGEMSVSDSVTMTIIDGHEEFTLGVKAISTEELNGDQSQTALYHDMAAVIIETPKPNHAPIAQAKTSSLLGLIGLDALGLLNLGTNQAYRAYDQDNNIAKVHINYRGVLNLGSINFSYSEVLAKEFGLKIETSYNPGVLGLLIPSSSITITAMDGGAIDNLKIMEFLASVHMGDKFLDVKVLDATTITVTDIYGLSDSATVGSLADINLIDLAKHDSIIEGNEHDNIIVGTDKNDRIYGGDGEDILYGGKGNDILRGGEGNDTLYGEEGDDVLIGGIGADKLYGGVGNDTLYTDFHTDASGNYKGDIVLDGGEGFDTLILEGNNGIDFSQLSYNPIKNMEVLDLREGDHKLENIKLSDVISMTDQNKELIILGDQKDKVSFKNEGSNTWTKVEGTGDNAGFEIYTNSGDPTVTVKVQEYIDDQII